MLLIALCVTAACVYGIESASTEDHVVPESINFMETSIPNARGIVDHYDDDSDHDQQKNPTPDSEGNNPITGEPVTKTSNGMKDTHLRENTETGRRYVNNPGYTPADSSTSAGKHYYLGSGRRRVGAGFGRRRAPVQTVNKEDELADKKRYQTKLKDEKFMAKLTAMAHNMVSGFNSKKDSKAPELTKEEFKALAEEVMGLKSGPSFYSDYNYKGTSVTKSSSISAMGDTQITNNDLSSLKVPKGWCVTLFTKKMFEGQSLKLCATLEGPKRVWNLKKYPLTLHYGNIAAKDFNSGPTTSLKTTWNNQASSIGVTKFHYVRHEVPQKCVKTCGVAPHIFVGKVTCLESHFREKKKTVANKNCRAVGLRMPQIPKLSCPATPACVNYKTSKSTVTCAKCCGFQGKMYYGKVWCQVRLRNKKDGILPELCFPGTKDCEIRAVAKDVNNEKHVGNPKCMHWELVMPPRPQKKCSKMPACTAFETKTPYQLGKRCTKTCSFNGNTIHGTSFCKKTGFNKNAGVVNQGCSEQSAQDKTLNIGKATDSKCSFWNQSKPAVPKQVCKPTARCTKYVTKTPSALRQRCSTSCGSASQTLYGSVNCVEVASGRKVPDSKCSHWNHVKPPVLTQYCAAVAACTKYVTKTPSALGKTCPTSCGHPYSYIYGSVHCAEVRSGREVSDSKCSHWNHAKPQDVPYQGCDATAACRKCRCSIVDHETEIGRYGAWQKVNPNERHQRTYPCVKAHHWCYIDSGNTCSDSHYTEQGTVWSELACPELTTCKCSSIPQRTKAEVKIHPTSHWQKVNPNEYHVRTNPCRAGGGPPWCYIDSGNACSDSHLTEQGTFWSELACQVQKHTRRRRSWRF